MSAVDAALREAVIGIARQAGAAIMQVYADGFDVEHKDDLSPLTSADLAAHHVIVRGLAQLTPDLPVLSEESAACFSQYRLELSSRPISRDLSVI